MVRVVGVHGAGQVSFTVVTRPTPISAGRSHNRLLLSSNWRTHKTECHRLFFFSDWRAEKARDGTPGGNGTSDYPCCSSLTSRGRPFGGDWISSPARHRRRRWPCVCSRLPSKYCCRRRRSASACPASAAHSSSQCVRRRGTRPRAQ